MFGEDKCAVGQATTAEDVKQYASSNDTNPKKDNQS
jgi:hypothetical protein